jgi:hypothetical protein
MAIVAPNAMLKNIHRAVPMSGDGWDGRFGAAAREEPGTLRGWGRPRPWVRE